MTCQGGAWVVTKYPDGTEIHAHPSHTEEEQARAEALGYPNVDAMTLDHDPMHHVVSWLLRQRVSYVVTGEANAELAEAEEHVVLAVQRYMQTLRKIENR